MEPASLGSVHVEGVTGISCTLTGCPFFGELSNTSIVPGSARVTVYETGIERSPAVDGAA